MLYLVSSAPVIISVTAIDSHSVHVTWRAPAEPNGVITVYTITYTQGSIYVRFNGEAVSIDKCIKYRDQASTVCIMLLRRCSHLISLDYPLMNT